MGRSATERHTSARRSRLFGPRTEWMEDTPCHGRVPMKRKWICLALAIVLLASSTSRAWNHTGHMTVALIAYRRLPERERQALVQLLQSHPHYRRYLAAEKPPEARADEWSFLRAATWPD